MWFRRYLEEDESLVKVRRVKLRKDYFCDECDALIQQGNKFVKIVAQKADGKKRSICICQECVNKWEWLLEMEEKYGLHLLCYPRQLSFTVDFVKNIEKY